MTTLPPPQDEVLLGFESLIAALSGLEREALDAADEVAEILENG